MALVGVPWLVENGAQVGAEVGRVLANVATRDSQGIALPGDCKITATATASGQVQMAAGGLVVRNQQQAGESYITAARGTTLVSVDPTAGSSRSDLVVVRVKDPDFSPWQTSDVPDSVNGPYSEPYVIKGVSPTTTKASDVVTYSAVELARIDVPANTTNITNSMIHDLRSLVMPRSQRTVRGVNNDEQHTFFYADTNWHTWPLSASFSVFIPPWATHLVYSVALGTIVPLYMNSSATTGFLRLNVGDGAIVGDSIQWEVDAQNSINPINILNADEYPIPANLRGTTVSVWMEGRRVTGTSQIQWNPASSLAMDLNFEERIA